MSHNTWKAILEELFDLSPTASIADVNARKKANQSARKEPIKELGQIIQNLYDFSTTKVVLRRRKETET